MEKTVVKPILILAVLSLLLTTSGLTTGLGIYVPTYGKGTATATIGDSDYDFEYDINHIGFGFVMDTRVARAGVFNYRLNLGYESVDYGFSNDETFLRLTIDNTFGFGVLQTRIVRLWIGPQVRLAFMRYFYEFDYGSNEILVGGLGLAPVFGANFNLGSVISICPELGYRFEFYGGQLSTDYDYIYDSSTESDDYISVNKEFFIKLSIIFRINDVFDEFY